MPENKLTPEQVKKALECCANNGDCKECAINPHKGNYGYCTSIAMKYALDLINRQQAEIERLRENNKAIMQTIADVHTEAIKEFAEELSKRSIGIRSNFDFKSDIDNLVKEMIGE